MGADADKRGMHHFFMQDKVVGNKIYYNIQQGITTAACYIAKGLPVYHFLKRNVKIVQDSNN